MESKINKNEIKQIVVALRTQGKTFQAISDELEQNYGIKRTRQGIKSLYDRAMEDKDTATQEFSKICAVVNLYALGYFRVDIVDHLKNMGMASTRFEVSSIINENKEYVEAVEQTMILRLADMMDKDYNKTSLSMAIGYEGIPATISKLYELLVKAATLRTVRFVESNMAYLDKKIGKSYKEKYLKQVKETLTNMDANSTHEVELINSKNE